MPSPTPHLSRITLYPVKSLDGLSVASSALVGPGALAHDREFAIIDGQGRKVSAAREPRVHGLIATVDFEIDVIAFRRRVDSEGPYFHLYEQRAQIDDWLSDFFQYPVNLMRNRAGGYPEDSKRPGPTVISAATLAAVQSWFPDLTLESIRRRFRANLEIDGVPAFWEDRLFGETDDQPVPFQIGAVRFEGVGPCPCGIAAARDQSTAVSYPHFQQTFARRRRANLPDWTPHARFAHYDRLGVSTRVPKQDGPLDLRVGLPVTLAGG